ncbi:hypothetical protein SLS55_005953 [Diplodia seriata]|uniref:AB hydrolase-1 domain-containing protein n=1 Tax=Diplodia seriata TaxID=420778 RepID=A0ABR3CCV7_9PEZI
MLLNWLDKPGIQDTMPPLELHSLATDPSDGEKRAATLTFKQSPSFLDPLERTWTAASKGIDNESVSLTLDLDFFGFTPFHSSPDSECAVDFMWLRDALPKDFPQARIFVYGYDSKLINSKSFQEIPDLSLNFRDHMSNILSGSRQLILIGHSLGGLLVKEAFSRDAAATLNSISGLLFFGAPSEGLDNEALQLMVKDQPNGYLVKTLGRSSGVLRTQMTAFRRVFEESRFLTFWYYETEMTPTPKQTETDQWKMTGECRKLVEQGSATNGVPSDTGRHHVRGIQKNHSEMVKLQGVDDTVYKSILGDLKKVTSDVSHDR